ncbi:hypothetical protein LI328DRAFT_172345 [Trichoderma asperelloides]|nr:hypothetical protein LI328DRAFT_172345 [Trichoderma asperelloides]
MKKATPLTYSSFDELYAAMQLLLDPRDVIEQDGKCSSLFLCFIIEIAIFSGVYSHHYSTLVFIFDFICSSSFPTAPFPFLWEALQWTNSMCRFTDVLLTG